jgi:hypothetical protein
MRLIGLVVVHAVGLAFASPLSEAQSASRVGMLIPVSGTDAETNIEAFRQGLRELGYVEGRDIRIEPGIRRVETSDCETSRPSWLRSRLT